jgi:acyl CoA:acetate/3-ketoacid CoA transferase alpha subunit
MELNKFIDEIYNGKSVDLARGFGIPVEIIYQRLKRGVSNVFLVNGELSIGNVSRREVLTQSEEIKTKFICSEIERFYKHVDLNTLELISLKLNQEIKSRNKG